MLTYTFDEREGESLYGHLYRCIRRDIEAGTLPADMKLPSKRAFAKHLGVSLITVEGAYQQLVAEGYVRAEPRRGFFVNDLPLACAQMNGGKRPRGETEAAVARFGAHEVSVPAAASAPSSLVADLATGSVATELFPYALWAKTLRDVLAHEPERTLLGETSAFGSLCLREALATHLRTFRGLEADPAQIIVGSGAQTLYNFIVQLVGRRSHFAVEDPGYPRLTSIYRANDVLLSHVPLDAAGIDVAALRASGANVAHLMPSHQYPTGLVTPVSRRYELLGWAAEEEGRYLIEDDYDCEFRLAGRPIPAMKSIDATDRVIYVNTFARSLGPSFRIGYAVLPAHLAERFQRDLGFYSCTVSTIEQLAVARFIENGDFERHINRMRVHYRTVKNALIEALTASPAGQHFAIEGADAGLHFLLRITTSATESYLTTAAREEGVVLAPLSAFCQQPAAVGTLEERSHQNAFVINYAALNLESIPQVTQSLTRAIEKTTTAASS
ncbi:MULTISPECIES: PLP-dependent aminotransferase family protein [Gordonibacter]|uniref:PLP-dependent aminotransferase family protein n=1 Tax=Gordonibacter faecis TaxID=3047475 RepID=A0ABT7DRH1_9ACTN|nr:MULTISPECIES: PLP-dependent aminotransferase family protein [unclassified Gordonibacter]MDJ1651183.1 PLP-dependent aminotransferase family protein [Gordonibacter sp. KGMB12511]HIW77351.1 PLP-dependent aminotransferase family protein [Candidatus Gordonibacter avicola]